MTQKEDIRKIRVLVAYGDHIQEDTIIELESVRYNIAPDQRATEAMILLAEAAGLVAKNYHVHHGYYIPR